VGSDQRPIGYEQSCRSASYSAQPFSTAALLYLQLSAHVCATSLLYLPPSLPRASLETLCGGKCHQHGLCGGLSRSAARSALVGLRWLRHEGESVESCSSYLRDEARCASGGMTGCPATLTRLKTGRDPPSCGVRSWTLRSWLDRKYNHHQL